MPSLRKEIAEALNRSPLGLREISQLFKIREREALDHLQHIAKSAHPRKFSMDPAQCKRCGFIFKKRDRLSAPSRCPICRSESITPPRYQILP